MTVFFFFIDDADEMSVDFLLTSSLSAFEPIPHTHSHNAKKIARATPTPRVKNTPPTFSSVKAVAGPVAIPAF